VFRTAWVFCRGLFAHTAIRLSATRTPIGIEHAQRTNGHRGFRYVDSGMHRSGVERGLYTSLFKILELQGFYLGVADGILCTWNSKTRLPRPSSPRTLRAWEKRSPRSSARAPT